MSRRPLDALTLALACAGCGAAPSAPAPPPRGGDAVPELPAEATEDVPAEAAPEPGGLRLPELDFDASYVAEERGAGRDAAWAYGLARAAVAEDELPGLESAVVTLGGLRRLARGPTREALDAWLPWVRERWLERLRAAAGPEAAEEDLFRVAYREGEARYRRGDRVGALRVWLLAYRRRPALVAPLLGLFAPEDPAFRTIFRSAAPRGPALELEPPAAAPPAPGVRDLRGRVRADLPVTVTVQGRTVEPGPDGELEARVELPPGEHRLSVEVRDLLGRSVRFERRVLVREPTPAWYDALPREARPPLPLPPGVAWSADPGRYVAEVDGSELVWVPAGEVALGGRTIAVPGFFLGRVEVTWSRYRRFCAETGRAPPGPRHEVGPDHPAHGVSWSDARDYCAWAGLRLPSEAEWALAAGAGLRTFPWGDAAADPTRLNAAGDEDGHADSAPTASFPAGAAPSGALGLAGNVSEWVADAWARDPADVPEDGSPRSGPDDAWRVVRGGCWQDADPRFCRSDARSGNPPDTRGSVLGFRVARSAD